MLEGRSISDESLVVRSASFGKTSLKDKVRESICVLPNGIGFPQDREQEIERWSSYDSIPWVLPAKSKEMKNISINFDRLGISP